MTLLYTRVYELISFYDVSIFVLEALVFDTPSFYQLVWGVYKLVRLPIHDDMLLLLSSLFCQ